MNLLIIFEVESKADATAKLQLIKQVLPDEQPVISVQDQESIKYADIQPAAAPA